MLDAAILAAILEEPDRIDLRLIAADWLDENREGGRAEFIRVQCELHGCRDCRCNGYCDPSLCRQCWLSRREKELLQPAWFKTSVLGDRATWTRGFVNTIHCWPVEWQRQTPPSLLVVYQTIGQRILSQHPVEYVKFPDSRLQIKYSPMCKQADKKWSLTLNTGLSHGMMFFASRADLIDAMPLQIGAWGLGQPIFGTSNIREAYRAHAIGQAMSDAMQRHFDR